MKLSPHFDSKEFACKCGCGFDKPDPELIEKLEKLRAVCNTPLVINSGCRCKKHNAKVGGKPSSQHLLGKAADVRLPKGMDANVLAKYAEDIGFNGIGKYDTFVHVDVRQKKSYWDYRQKKKK